jgi:hypothetical protein
MFNSRGKKKRNDPIRDQDAGITKNASTACWLMMQLAAERVIMG